jgi:hypothetical protein
MKFLENYIIICMDVKHIFKGNWMTMSTLLIKDMPCAILIMKWIQILIMLYKWVLFTISINGGSCCVGGRNWITGCGRTISIWWVTFWNMSKIRRWY